MLRFFRRSKRKKNKPKKLVKRAILLGRTKRLDSSTFENASLPTLVRLEKVSNVSQSKKKLPIINKNKESSTLTPVTNLLDNSNVCTRRREVRREIMRRTRGKGLRVKQAQWTLDSYIQCKGD